MLATSEPSPLPCLKIYTTHGKLSAPPPKIRKEATKAVTDKPKAGGAGRIHNFPCVTISDKWIYFNSAAKHFIGNAPCCRVFFPGEYIVFKFGGTGKPMSPNKSGMRCHSNEIKYRIKPGSYRLYKYRDGYAIKRHEPLVPPKTKEAKT